MNNPMKDKDLKKGLLPRQMMSADHSIFQALGRLYQIKDKSDPSEMCVCVLTGLWDEQYD